MADTQINPLPSGTKLINPDGTPTQFFQRWAQERSIDISQSISLADAQALVDSIGVTAPITKTGTVEAGNLKIGFDGGLKDLSDVDFSTAPTDGQVIVYDADTEKWKPVDESGGSGDVKGTDTGPVGAIGVVYAPFWRLLIADSVQGRNIGIAECIFAASAGGPQQAVGGTASATSIIGSGNAASQAFDNNVNTWWISDGFANQALEYAFTTSVGVAEVRITARNDGYSNNSPQDFSVQYSEDGQTWNTAVTFTGVNTWTNGSTMVFTVPGAGAEVVQYYPTKLAALNDVSKTAPIDGQVLTWSATDSKWEPKTPSGGGGGGGAVKLATVTIADNSTSSFSLMANIPDTYRELFIEAVAGSTSTDVNSSDFFRVVLNGDTAGHYNWTLFGAYTGSGPGPTNYADGRNNDTGFGAGSLASTGVAGVYPSYSKVRFPRYSDLSSAHSMLSEGVVHQQNVINFALNIYGIWAPAAPAAITSIDISDPTHPFAQGSVFTLYGLA